MQRPCHRKELGYRGKIFSNPTVMEPLTKLGFLSKMFLSLAFLKLIPVTPAPIWKRGHHLPKRPFSPSSNTCNTSLHSQCSSPNSLLNSNIIITVTLCFKLVPWAQRLSVYFLLTLSLIYKSESQGAYCERSCYSLNLLLLCFHTLHRYLCSFSTKGETGVRWKQNHTQQGRIPGKDRRELQERTDLAPRKRGPLLGSWR